MKKFLATCFVAVLAVTVFGVQADAAETVNRTTDTDFTVKSGHFNLTAPGLNSFGETTLKDLPETYATSFDSNFNVQDLTGNQAGWRLDVSASQFKDGTDTLPRGSITLMGASKIERNKTGQGALPTAMQTSKIIDNGAVTVVTAPKGTGMGSFDVTFPQDAVRVKLDATTAKVTDGAASYKSTLNWDLVQAP